MRLRIVLIVLVALGLAAAAVYVRRKRAVDGLAPVQLGAREGSTRDLSAADAGVADIQSAAAQVRAAFQGT